MKEEGKEGEGRRGDKKDCRSMKPTNKAPFLNSNSIPSLLLVSNFLSKTLTNSASLSRCVKNLHI